MLKMDTADHRTKKTDALVAHRSQQDLVVSGAPTGFCLEAKMAKKFSEEDQIYFEVPSCPSH